MKDPAEVLHPFVVETRHLASPLNMIVSDMIRDRSLVNKLDDDPDHFTQKYSLKTKEFSALRARDLPTLFHLGLHPFLLVRFAGMMGILEYWQALGAPGRGGWPRNS
jgi:hypothetical protein